MKKVFIIIGLALATITLNAEQNAFTTKGQKVLLKDDSTWVLVKEEKTSNYSFRKSSWGMNKEAIKASETIEVNYENDTMLVYPTTISNLDCSAVYVFVNDLLVRSRYFFKEEHSNENDYIDDYGTLKSLLANKYGKPIEDESYWKDDLYKSDYSEWGMAISIGHLIYYSSWETETTTINLQLFGDNYELSLIIDYKSKELSNLEEEVKKENALNDL